MAFLGSVARKCRKINSENRDVQEYRTPLQMSNFWNKTGRYLVGLSPNKNAKDEKCKRAGGHIVCVMRLQGQPMAVDTWDSAEMLVDCFMRIKKVLPKDSPQTWK